MAKRGRNKNVVNIIIAAFFSGSLLASYTWIYSKKEDPLCPHKCALKPAFVNSSNFHGSNGRQAWVILVADDTPVEPNGLSYADSAAVLVHTLQRAGTSREIVVLVDHKISSATRMKLKALKTVVREIDNKMPPENYRMSKKRERMQYSYTKLWAFTLTEYSKVVYVDADMFVLPWCRDIDAMFAYASPAASLEYFATDSFQCGMYVIEPSHELFNDIEEKRHDVCSYENRGVDSGFMNCYFKDRWHEVEQRFNAQYFCNTRPFDDRCKAFIRDWWDNNENRRDLCMVHDKIFKHLREKSEVNEVWWKAFEETQGKLKSA